MRILLVSDYYPPHIGGAHRQIQLLASELSKRGHEVQVATNWQPGTESTQVDANAVTVHRIKQIRTSLRAFYNQDLQQHSTPFPDLITVMGLRRVIKAFDPQIVHVYGWIAYSCAVALLGTQIPMVVSSREYGYSCANRALTHFDEICSGPGIGKCLPCAVDALGVAKGAVAYLSVFYSRRFLLSRTSGIHSVSDYVQEINRRDWVRKQQDQLAARGGRIQEGVIFSFLIDAPAQLDTEHIFEQLPDEPYILFVGGLQKRKGIELLLDAYARLDSPPPLVLIGYVGPDSPREFPPNVRVIEDVPHHQVMAAWSRCLFGIVPSLWADPSPGVVRECMSVGKPVIGTAVGGITEMIDDGQNGLIVQEPDADDLAQAMQRLIGDQALCAQMGLAARERAREFEADVSMAKFERLYQAVLAHSA